MIKYVNQGNTGGYMQVITSGHSPYISPNSSNPLTGMIRQNGYNYEVFDGNTWQMMMSYSEVSLNQTAIAALDWCQRKMIEEAKIKELAEKSPTVADAFATFNSAREQLEIVLALTE